MTVTEFLLMEFDREVVRSRRALEQVPEGQFDWKPHEKSMIFGYLANLVAIMPSWIALQVTTDDLDVAPAQGSAMPQEQSRTSATLIAALDKAAVAARDALTKTTDEHLNTPWQLKARGQVVMEAPRYAMIRTR